jgi:hypothetical protein
VAEAMQRIEPILGEGNEVAVPCFFGDSEIRSLEMNLDLAVVTFINHGIEIEGKLWNASRIRVSAFEPAFVCFESNHLQNVVDAVYLHGPDTLSSFFELNNVALRVPENCRSLAKQFFCVAPITGGEVLVAADSFEFQEERTSDWEQEVWSRALGGRISF